MPKTATSPYSVPDKIYVVLLLCLLLFVPLTYAETNGNPKDKALNNAADSSINVESIENKIKFITEKQGLDEARKSEIISIYHSVKENLADIKQFQEKITYYQDALQSAPTKIKTLQAEIDRNAKGEKTTENFQTIPTDELEQRYIIEKGKLSDIDDEIKKNESELLVQNSRPQLIHTETVAAKQAMDDAQLKLENFLHNTDAKLETEAQQLYLRTEVDAHAAEIKMYDLEAISSNVRIQLIKVNLQILTAQRVALEPVILAIEEHLAQRRQEEANKVSEELSQAEKDVADKPTVIQNITRENIQFSRDLQKLTQNLEREYSQKSEIDAQTATILENQKSAEKKIMLAGLSPALGKALRDQRRNLRFPDDFWLQSQTLENETAVASLNQFKVEDNLKLLSNIDNELNRLIDEEIPSDTPVNSRLRIKAELRILLNNQKEVLSKLSNLYINYLHALNDLSFSRQQLVNQADEFANFLDKRLLWVPSSLPIDMEFPKQIYHALRWFLSPQQWFTILNELLSSFAKHPLIGCIALLNLLGILVFKKKLIQLIAENNSQVLKPQTDRFKFTSLNIIYIMILVAPMGLLFNYLGWFLSNDFQLSSFTKAVGIALRSLAMPLYCLQLFYQLFTSDGIARKHFHWRKSPLVIIRQQLNIIIYLILPTIAVIVITNNYTNASYTDSLGRLALIINLCILGFVLESLSRPKNEILPKHIYDNSLNWLDKLRWFWRPCLIGIPLIITIFAASGYYQSALEINAKFIHSLTLIVIAIMGHELVIRWLILVNRQLAQENARLHEVLSEDVAETNVNERLFDISAINAQTMQILNVTILVGLLLGAWMVWKDILPAFSILDQIELWQHTVIENTQEVQKPITLTNFIFACAYFIIALIMIRNLTGVMELTLFRRLSIEVGSRYAVVQLSKYVIFTLALIRSAAELGGSWSQVQWLAAALGVGLGFGLQEIFANMISGIILLFERPIRVGDTVTVGDITGIVNRIQIRATTLIDGDQKELIVPNKTFITSQLINWTLTDPVTRVVIPIGIAYGSDLELAHKIMLDTIYSIPQILKFPEPNVVLIGFGDSALNFSIRIFVGKLNERIQVTHELHLKLEQAFRKHNIVLPFPQQDVHIHHTSSDMGNEIG